MSSLELVSTLPFNNSCTFPNDILTQLYLYTAWIQLHQCRILEPNNLNYSVFSDSVYHFPANVSFLCVALLIYIPEVTSRPSSPNGMFPVVPIAVSVAVGAVLVIAAIIVVICCCRRRANGNRLKYSRVSFHCVISFMTSFAFSILTVFKCWLMVSWFGGTSHNE